MSNKITNIDPNKQYKVELVERIELHGTTFYPGDDLTLRGDVLSSLAPEAIANAEEV